MENDPYKKNWGKVLLVFSLFFVSCGSNDLKPEDFEPYEGPVTIIDNLDLTYSDSAKIRIRLKAPVQKDFLNNDREFPDGVDLTFFSPQENPETTLLANYGRVDGTTGIYVVRGNVIIENLKEQRKLHTEELYWNPKSQKIYTEKNVIIDQYGKRLMGKGLTAAQDFSTYQIKNLQGVIPLETLNEEDS